MLYSSLPLAVLHMYCIHVSANLPFIPPFPCPTVSTSLLSPSQSQRAHYALLLNTCLLLALFTCHPLSQLPTLVLPAQSQMVQSGTVSPPHALTAHVWSPLTKFKPLISISKPLFQQYMVISSVKHPPLGAQDYGQSLALSLRDPC